MEFLQSLTIDEISILKSSYRTFSSKDIQILIYKKCLTHRTIPAIESKAFFLGITKKSNQLNWLDLEVEYLKKHYIDLSVSDIAKNLDRSIKSVQSKISILGLKKNVKWSKEDIKYLIDNYNNTLLSDISLTLGYSYNSCSNMAGKLNLSRSIKISEDDKKFLIDNCKKFDVSTLSKKLNISIKTIYTKFNDLGISDYKRSESQKKFTKQEDDYILKNYNKLGYKQIAKELNRTYSSISHRVSRLKSKIK